MPTGWHLPERKNTTTYPREQWVNNNKNCHPTHHTILSWMSPEVGLSPACWSCRMSVSLGYAGTSGLAGPEPISCGDEEDWLSSGCGRFRVGETTGVSLEERPGVKVAMSVPASTKSGDWCMSASFGHAGNNLAFGLLGREVISGVCEVDAWLTEEEWPSSWVGWSSVDKTDVVPSFERSGVKDEQSAPVLTVYRDLSRSVMAFVSIRERGWCPGLCSDRGTEPHTNDFWETQFESNPVESNTDPESVGNACPWRWIPSVPCPQSSTNPMLSNTILSAEWSPGVGLARAATSPNLI